MALMSILEISMLLSLSLKYPILSVLISLEPASRLFLCLSLCFVLFRQSFSAGLSECLFFVKSE